jgi:hypothetical protein
MGSFLRTENKAAFIGAWPAPQLLPFLSGDCARGSAAFPAALLASGQALIRLGLAG